MTTPLYSTNPNFIGRHYGVVDLSVSMRQVDPRTQTIRFVGAKDLLSNPVSQSTLFTVPKNGEYRSPTLRKNRKDIVAESNRGLTRASFDPDDFAGTNFHGEGAINFVKIEELDGAGTEIRESAWLVIPPPDFFASGRRTLILNGVSAQVATPVGYSGLPPKGCLVIKLPKYADSVEITNTGTDPMFFALGAGHQEIEILSGTTYQAREAGASVIFLRCEVGGNNFNASLALVNGIEA